MLEKTAPPSVSFQKKLIYKKKTVNYYSTGNGPAFNANSLSEERLNRDQSEGGRGEILDGLQIWGPTMFGQLKTRLRNRNRQQRHCPPFRITPKLEQLEDRCCPIGIVPDAGGNQPDYWNPVDAGNLYSDKNNWSLKQIPLGGLSATFDGAVNKPCVVDIDPNNAQSLGTPFFQLTGGFTAQITINPGINCEIGLLLDSSPSADNFNVAFGNNALLTFTGSSGNSILYNFTFTCPTNATTGVNITNGTVQADTQGTETTQVPINVLGNSPATSLQLAPIVASDSCTFQLQNNAYIKVQGSNSSLVMRDLGMSRTFVLGGGADYYGNGTTEDIEIVNGAVATITVGSSCHDFINVPIRNDSSSVYFNGPGDGSMSSSLYIAKFSNNTNDQFSYFAIATTGWAWTYLAGGVTVTAEDGYEQYTNSGYLCVLQTTDSFTDSLNVNSGSVIYIGSNTKIRIDPFDPNGYFGILWLSGHVSMFGELDVEINGPSGGAGNESLLKVFGDMAWSEPSIIRVYIDGGYLNTGQNWTVIDATGTLSSLDNVTFIANSGLFLNAGNDGGDYWYLSS